MFFKSCKYLTDYCLLLHLFQRKISSWSFYAKLEIELYRLWIIEWIAEFCCFWCLDHCIYTSSGAGLHPCPVLSSSILPSPHSPTSMLWQAALAFEIPVAPSWLSAGPLLLWSTCFCSSCFQLEGFSHLGQICCSFLPRTDCSNLRYLSLTRAITTDHDPLRSLYSAHQLTVFHRAAVSIPDVSDIPSCRRSPAAVWWAADSRLLSRELCRICAGCLLLKGHSWCEFHPKEIKPERSLLLLCPRFT